MLATQAPEQTSVPDSGLICLALLARYHGQAAEPAQMRHVCAKAQADPVKCLLHRFANALMSTDPRPAASATARPKRYLDPKIDLAFKRVFGEHANLLKSFLNALLPLPDDGQIESLEYLTPEQVPEVPGFFKNSIVDVKCTDQRGRIFIVEMQMMWSASFGQRMVFGASQAYVKQFREGQSWSTLRPVYALALINGTIPASSGIAGDDYYHHYRIVNVEQPRQVLKGLEFVFIELPRFRPESRSQKRLQTLWLRFLREVGSEPEQVIDAALTQERDIAEALDLVEQSAYTEAELDGYHAGVDRATTHISMIEDAEAKGKAEGKAEGELAKARTIAAALLAEGLSPERVAALTGLPMAQLRTP